MQPGFRTVAIRPTQGSCVGDIRVMPVTRRRAKDGQRRSKKKMNGVDPLEVFDKYGVDATRLTLASVGTTDTRWNEKQVESYRNFANKIWNAARFCLLNSEGATVDPKALNAA